MIARIRINGFRGFDQERSFELAVPDGNTQGSGLTIFVGANNSGKTTVLEALRVATQPSVSFTPGRRNITAGDQVSIEIEGVDANSRSITSIAPGGSETMVDGDYPPNNILALPARRSFSPWFSKGEQSRDDYVRNSIGFGNTRIWDGKGFSSRLFAAQKNKDAFNEVLSRVLNPVPNWIIDQADNGSYFLRIVGENSSHSSEGLGEGIVSLLFIIDTLYDSHPGSVISIDEPELSLHPSLQRRLLRLLLEYSRDRQIVIASHSPYFVDISALAAGAKIYRMKKVEDSVRPFSLSQDSIGAIGGLLQNVNNPHIFGLMAKEIFFLDDSVVLVEGQEDVVFYERILQLLGRTLNGEFFGWGVGGASNMPTVLRVLRDLGVEKVSAILDADQRELATQLAEEFRDVHIEVIPANDVRTKAARRDKPAVEGLLDERNREIRQKYEAQVAEIFNRIIDFMN